MSALPPPPATDGRFRLGWGKPPPIPVNENTGWDSVVSTPARTDDDATDGLLPVSLHAGAQAPTIGTLMLAIMVLVEWGLLHALFEPMTNGAGRVLSVWENVLTLAFFSAIPAYVAWGLFTTTLARTTVEITPRLLRLELRVWWLSVERAFPFADVVRFEVKELRSKGSVYYRLLVGVRQRGDLPLIYAMDRRTHMRMGSTIEALNEHLRRRDGQGAGPA